MWQSWDPNPSLNMKAVALPIQSHCSSEAGHGEEMENGREADRAGEPEGTRGKGREQRTAEVAGSGCVDNRKRHLS